ncbi:hypothetical protein MsAg5_06050 [Methanosarcinaceae archaeon Ag5]|uniref:Uncharacterized protein n=2 Tax=Methanolapillus africanus TaxID=3028297 RepID=A0AAE4MIZ3_9EURY|nr:hypothetical protein [Methanosarcinaceae archaeon Ag5]
MYGERLLRRMKVEIECDCEFLEIQIPIAGDEIIFGRESLNLLIEARSIYGETADWFFLMTRYQDY